MPHINRIRVNNVKYNFGTQFYDDFMMRFSCKNTIYDLANGGGKSVLMLLLLQNLIPNCTLDEKQPIEKLFRTSGGSNTIHSLVEWKLDPCYQKDNFKYMTTGFCARKGKDSGEDEARESASIEYFNYCIFYREFGDNDIKNLPLSKDGERITYNGLKSYLRDLEKKDHGIEVHIFEKKGDYQNFISRFGLFESEWEIIRGINKTEGHVRTYFETNYKTGRKVVEDLLIEEIIQKSFQNQIGNNGDDDSMAKTLLDIKDRIIELSRRKEEINLFDKQIALMEELSAGIADFKDYQGEKESLKNMLLEKLAVCRNLSEKLSCDVSLIEQQIDEAKETYEKEDKLISVARMIDDRKALEQLKILVSECAEKIAGLLSKEEEIKGNIELSECAEAYEEHKKYQMLKDEVLLALDSRVRNNQDIYDEIHALAATAHRILTEQAVKCNELVLDFEEQNIELKQEYEKAQSVKDEMEIKAAISEKELLSVQSEIEEKEGHFRQLISDNGILVAENIEEEIAHKNAEINTITSDIREKEEKLSSFRTAYDKKTEELYDVISGIKVLEHQKKQLEQSLGENKADQNKLDSFAAIYGESDTKRLETAIYGMYKQSVARMAELEVKISDMTAYVSQLSKGRYILDGHQYRAVEEYLFNTYGEDVMYGYDWFATLTQAQRRDVLKRVPFLDYSFVIKGDFERIKEDANLRNFSHSSYIVPIISEMILRDMHHASSVEFIVFGTKDLSFLSDPGKVKAELDKVSEELYEQEENLRKLKTSQNVLWEDYLYILSVNNMNNNGKDGAYEDILSQLDDKAAKRDEASKEKEELKNSIHNLEMLIEKAKEENDSLDKQKAALVHSKEVYDELNRLYKQKQDMTNEASRTKMLCEQYREAAKKSYDEWQNVKVLWDIAKEEKEDLNRQWKDTFEPYYSDEYADRVLDLPYEQIVVKMNGLVSAVNNENADVNDKKTLIRAYEDHMEKCRKEIENRGYTLGQIKEKLESDSEIKNIQNISVLKNRLKDIQSDIAKQRSENESLNAQMNRMEGSLTHAGRIVEEKYGEFEFFECENTGQFIAEHTNLKKVLKERCGQLESQMKKAVADVNEVTLIGRDIERMLQNAGVTIPSQLGVAQECDISALDGYEVIQKDYEKLIRSEYKKREEFAKQKRQIMDALRECNAFDLADEIDRSIGVPEGTDEIRIMTENIEETCRCIRLEKDRVGKGIEDMERIKDSFENRCIQICCNIKAELDRLPKLSKITLDNEVISMIGLNIPYVKEEFYKERMSSYISDTITLSENFKTEEERILYIKNRLYWKKLFSVIVTDMNGIRLNLYKRERIKDQSRYLRYEEAVGSTGQSQGIYIQFLIAIINYISNINAAGREVSAIGKVVFIDNPFGAAKDIYIWEPIFKLLKANHVQLIVPARGVTPAITSRFDVNYILGQKMVHGRQQTVVVDYRSQVQNDEMEYTRLDYVQESMF